MMACKQLLLHCFLLFFLLMTRADEDPLLVMTTKGHVRGFTTTTAHGKTVDAFFGIPFARPPVGDLRFRRPRPLRMWDGILNATKPPNSCYQALDTTFDDFLGSAMWNANTQLSEDCLYLSIWVPQPRPTSSAVMVWIYGGGFVMGTLTLDIYDGATLAAEENVIVVSFQYRVGALGFLYLATEDAPGNAGMYDQVAALRWVRENIAAFGGNPQSVTIFGESAGGASASLHTLSPVSKELFNQAILMSGSATCPWAVLTRDVALDRAVKLTQRLNCLSSSEILAGNLPKLLACLRKVPASQIVNQQTDGFLDFSFVPVIDGEFLPASPGSILKGGGFKRSNIMLGSVSEEGTHFILYQFQQLLGLKDQIQMTYDHLIASLDNIFSKMFSRTAMDAIIFQYTDWLDPHNPIRNLDLLEKAVGDYYFTCNLNEQALSYAQAGHGLGIYMYTFTHQSSNLPWPKWVGVAHSSELDYVFGWPLDPKRGYTEDEEQLSKRMMKYWANFARTGNPSLTIQDGYSNHSWPVYSLSGKEHLMMDTKDPLIQGDVRATQCAFWKSYLPQLQRTSTNESCPRGLETSSGGPSKGQSSFYFRWVILSVALVGLV